MIPISSNKCSICHFLLENVKNILFNFISIQRLINNLFIH